MGDIVAAVVADTRHEAVDAAEAVFVDYADLPVVIDMHEALSAECERLFPEAETNVCFHTEFGDDGALEGAARVVHLVVESQRLAGVPIETNGALAIPDGDDLTVWIPSQSPIRAADAFAGALGISPPQLRVATPPAMGGGFGPKAAVYPEQILTALLARRLDRPVKWTETRSENMVSMVHGRAMSLDCSMGFDEDGIVTGMEVRLVADVGAYPSIGAVLPTFTQTMIQGVYAIPKIRFVADSVVTNTTTIGAYRGAGRPEATQMLERVLDVAAAEFGLDPAEIRRRNFIAPDAFPFTTLSGANYDNGEYAKVLDTAMEAAGIAALRAEQSERRAAGASRQLGIGLLGGRIGFAAHIDARCIGDQASIVRRTGVRPRSTAAGRGRQG